MRVNSHPVIIHQLDKKYLDNNKNEDDPKINKRIEEIIQYMKIIFILF